MACWEITHWVCWFSHSNIDATISAHVFRGFPVFPCLIPGGETKIGCLKIWGFSHPNLSAFPAHVPHFRHSIHQLKEPYIFRQTQILQKLNASWETDDKTLGFTAHTVGVHDGATPCDVWSCSGWWRALGWGYEQSMMKDVLKARGKEPAELRDTWAVSKKPVDWCVFLSGVMLPKIRLGIIIIQCGNPHPMVN